MTKKNDKYRIDRRTFVKLMGTAVGAIALSRYLPDLIPSASASVQVPQIPLAGKSIPKYVEPLPTFFGARVKGTVPLTVTMKEFTQQVLPAPNPALGIVGYPKTTVWGYEIFDGTTYGPLYPAHTIEALRGTATTVTYINNLGTATTPPLLQKYLTVDQTLHWADPLMNMGLMPMTPYNGPVPAVAHLHGGEVWSGFDGHPQAWWTPGAEGPGPVSPPLYQGPAYFTNVYTYPNQQEAATLWFHDHTLGVTRLNVYAGLAGFYFLRDAFDTGLLGNPLNLPVGKQEVEIVIQDRIFDIGGQLFFPDIGINPTVHPYWIPEFFGDVIVVNGKTWPFLAVDPRRYRFRFLNGSNARFYILSLGPKLPFWVIGTDGGLLDKPVMVKNLFLAPGERADVIVDFAPVAGTNITMTNSAKAPFPKGAAADPQTVGQIMQFQVAPTPVTDTTFNPALPGATLRGGATQPPAMVRLADGAGALAPGVTPSITRLLTLNEVMGAAGPLEVLVNNTKYDGTKSPNANGLANPTGITEMPLDGSTEVWEIVNLTADAHPIHLHLVQFQLISRQAFNVSAYMKKYNSLFPPATFNGVAYPGGVYIPEYGPPAFFNTTPKLGGNPDVAPYLQGALAPPDPEEIGWKDTFKMFPGEVTRVVVRWLPQNVAVGGTGTYPFDPKTGPGYVWHCHIIDHEDNEMMRPYKVV